MDAETASNAVARYTVYALGKTENVLKG